LIKQNKVVEEDVLIDLELWNVIAIFDREGLIKIVYLPECQSN